MASHASPHPLARKVALAGGLLLMLNYLIHLAYGFRTGRVLFRYFNGSLWSYAGGIAFYGVIVVLALALLSIAYAYRRQARMAYVVSLLPVAVAFLSGLVGLGTVVFLLGTSTGGSLIGMTSTAGVLSLYVGALIIGATCLLMRTLQTSTAVMVLLYGLLTMPVNIAINAVLRTAIAPWVLSELHFILAGIFWLAISRSLKIRKRQFATI